MDYKTQYNREALDAISSLLQLVSEDPAIRNRIREIAAKHLDLEDDDRRVAVAGTIHAIAEMSGQVNDDWPATDER